MFICVCKAVSDRCIGQGVEQEGITTFRELRAQLGVASVCGRCAPAARECLDTCLARRCAERAPEPGAEPTMSATAG